MGLPLYLAMTAAELAGVHTPPSNLAFMACQFSPYGQGITNIPDYLPERAMLILSDRTACQGHSKGLVLQQLRQAVEELNCESVLLDFQRPYNEACREMAQYLSEELTCPVAVSEQYAATLSCPLFLSPPPVHISMEEHIAPFRGREIWLEAALCQEDVVVTRDGTDFIPRFPPDGLPEGFYDEALCCCHWIYPEDDRIVFTLFDTPQSLEKKLDRAEQLGIHRAVGLYQELGTLNLHTQKPPVE